VGRPADRWALGSVGAIFLVAVADLVSGESVSLLPLLLLGPLLASIGAGPVRAAAVALLATLVALPLGAADGIFATDRHIVYLTLVAAGGFVGALVAGLRQRQDAQVRAAGELLETERRARARSEYVGRVAGLLEAPPDPEAMLAEITHLAIPDMADLCVVDLMEDGRLRGLAIGAADPALTERVRAMRTRFPVQPGSRHPVARVAESAEPLLVADIEDAIAEGYAEEPEHAAVVRRLGYRSSVVAPLVARGRLLGVLSLLRLGPEAERYDAADLDAAAEVARRAALALDSARLFRELAEAEGRLEAILTNLAEAVTVQRPDGELVFVNDAAVELLGFASAEELAATPVEVIRDRFLVTDEHGEPLDPERLPGRRALQGDEHPQPLLTRSVDRRTGVERWVLTKARPLRDADGRVTHAVNVMEDVTESRRAEREQRLLAGAQKLLSSSLDVELTVEKAAWAAVPELADWCCVDVPDERGRIVHRALAASPEKRAGLEAVRRAVRLDPADPASPAAALRDLKPRLMSDLTDERLRALAADAAGLDVLRHAAVRSLLTVPLAVGDDAVGLMTLGTDVSGRRLRETDVPLAAELGRRAGIAVANAQIHAARTEIAMTLQRSLLPPQIPVIAGLTIAARFRAAGSDEAAHVGGDFYDLFPTAAGWFVVIGDVTGKGPEAAALTSLARYTMRTAAAYEPAPGRVLARLNESLAAEPDRRRLVTALCALVEPREDGGGAVRLTLACGGHPPPLRLTPQDGVAPLPVAGPLLGAFEEAAWREHELELPPGEALVLYTDGVTDSTGPDGRFGADRLAEVCRGLVDRGAEEVAAGIDEALLAFERGPQRDDVAMLVLRAEDSAPATTIVAGGEAAA
jgi:PAS domain S-box-containing protein